MTPSEAIVPDLTENVFVEHASPEVDDSGEAQSKIRSDNQCCREAGLGCPG